MLSRTRLCVILREVLKTLDDVSTFDAQNALFAQFIVKAIEQYCSENDEKAILDIVNVFGTKSCWAKWGLKLNYNENAISAKIKKFNASIYVQLIRDKYAEKGSAGINEALNEIYEKL